MTSRATCASCRWWRQDPWRIGTHRAPATGTCRPRAPDPQATDSGCARWPVTHENDGCGEHAPKEEKGDAP